MKVLVITLTIITFSFSFASERPRWITETPPGFRNDYYVGFGESKLLEEAKFSPKKMQNRKCVASVLALTFLNKK